MRRAFAVALVVAVPAWAAGPFSLFKKPDLVIYQDPAERLEAELLAFVNGVGTGGHRLEVVLDAAFGSKGVSTQRLDAAFALQLPKSYVSLVARTGVAFDQAGIESVSGQGLVVSAGFRLTTDPGNFMLEAGFRYLPPAGRFGASNDPAPHVLALDAMLTSGAADDTRWVPLAGWGALQAYVDFVARTRAPLGVAPGVRASGQATVVPARVLTWLGPEQHFLGNIFVEPFLAIGPWRLQLGVHGEASLSSLWPADRPLPVVINGFIAVAPWRWLTLRTYFGGGFSPLAYQPSRTVLGGLRVQINAW